MIYLLRCIKFAMAQSARTLELRAPLDHYGVEGADIIGSL